MDGGTAGLVDNRGGVRVESLGHGAGSRHGVSTALAERMSVSHGALEARQDSFVDILTMKMNLVRARKGNRALDFISANG